MDVPNLLIPSTCRELLCYSSGLVILSDTIGTFMSSVLGMEIYFSHTWMLTKKNDRRVICENNVKLCKYLEKGFQKGEGVLSILDIRQH